jgi:ribose transport system substrate-binding protein
MNTSMRTMRALAALATLGLVAGCGGGDGARPDSGQAAAGAAGAGGAGGAAMADGKLLIAVIGKSSTNPVFLSARTGAEAAARELSQQHGINVEVAWLTPPQEDAQVQAQRIQQAVNDGADAILISCSDAGKVTGAINDAVQRGVEVMTSTATRRSRGASPSTAWTT